MPRQFLCHCANAAHNLIAALLLATLVTLNWRLYAGERTGRVSALRMSHRELPFVERLIGTLLLREDSAAVPIEAISKL